MAFVGNSRMLAVLIATIVLSGTSKPDEVLAILDAEIKYLAHEEPGTAAVLKAACAQAREMMGATA